METSSIKLILSSGASFLINATCGSMLFAGGGEGDFTLGALSVEGPQGGGMRWEATEANLGPGDCDRISSKVAEVGMQESRGSN